MKIKSFKKEKDNRYTLTFDSGEKVKFYDDVIVEYNLLSFKEMDEKKYFSLCAYNHQLEAYYKSLHYIEKKLRCEKEIQKYLEKDYDKKIITETISRLKEKGYLNEELYIKSYIMDQVHLGNNGPYKIGQDLLKLGFIEEDIRIILDTYEESVWLDKLEKLVNKKIKMNRSYGSNKLKEKILYDMSQLGYYKWMIEEVIKHSDFSSSKETMEKEYKKIKGRLEKKFAGRELDFQIKQKLLQKGFNSQEIEEFLTK